MLKQSFSLFIIFIFITTGLSAITNDSIFIKEAYHLLRKSKNDTVFHLNKLDYVQKALKIGENISDKRLQMLCLSEVGVIYLNINKYDLAHQYFIDALFLAKELNDIEEEASLYYLLGNLFGYLNNDEQALNYYNNFITINKEVGDTVFYGFVLNSIGILHMKQNSFDSAKVYFQQSINVFRSINLDYGLAYPTNNLGDNYLKRKQNDSALFYFNKALAYDEKFENIKGIAIIKCNIGLIHSDEGNYNEALKYFNQSLDVALKNEFRKVAYDCYKDISKMYEKKGKRDSALFYYHKYSSLKDSVLGIEMTNQISNYQKFLEKKEQDLISAENRNKIAILKAEKGELRYRMSLYIVAFVLLLIISLVVYYKQRNDIKNKKQILIQKEELQKIKDERNREIIERQKKEHNRIEKELEEKKGDLLNFGLDIARKNTFNNEVKDKVKALLNIPESNYKESLVELLFYVQNNDKIDKDLYLFQENVEKINTEFYSRLLEKHPSISKNEKSLCAMILLGLSIKEIALMRNISPASIEVARYRLRKKLGLQKGEKLVEFLKTI